MMSSSILHLYVHALFTPLVPTSPPDDINIEAIHATALMIFWRPPSYHPNGIIRRYVLRLSEIETGRQEQFFTNNTTITISNRHPFYYYSCIISAETIGQGPFSKAVIILMPEAGTLRSSSHCFLMCIQRTSRISFVLEQCLDNCLHNIIIFSASYYTGPALPPTDVGFVSVTSTSVLFVWKDPSRETLNGIIRSYSLQLTEENTGKSLIVTSKSRQKMFEVLHPFYNYTVRVAAFTVAIGPFSDPFTVTTLPDSKCHTFQ